MAIKCVYGCIFGSAAIKDSESLVHNYLNDNGTFYDAAATAFLAATVYRASTLMNEHDYVSFAERTRMTLFTPNTGVGTDTNG